jgi:uncharacterized protein YwlG (UPF0340 family)
MRPLVIVLAAVVSVLAVVKARRAAKLVAQNTRATNRKVVVENAAHQKPGQVAVPKIPKVKRHDG